MFGNKVELKEHISTAHDGYNCEKCNRNYTSKSGLKFHIAQEHEQKYPCPICGKSSGSSSSYNKHLASHTEGSDIKCPHCRYIFPNKDLFMAHRESCRMSRAYTCSHCGKGFPSKNSFQHHEATHFDGKFPCHICGIKFSFSTNLNRHIRTVHLAKSEPEDAKSPEKAGTDQTGSLPDVQKSDNAGEELFETGEAGGMEECHNNSLNQIVEAIKLQVERRISAGYCGNGDIPTKSVGTDAMDTSESNSLQKRGSNNQLSRQLASSEKDVGNQAVQQRTPTKSAASLGVQEFPVAGISMGSQKRPDVGDGNVWIALPDGSTKSARSLVMGQPPAAYQGDKPQTAVITNTENASQVQTQVYSDVEKKGVLNTYSEPLGQIGATTPDASVSATYRIIDQSLLSQLKSTTSPSVPTYRVISTSQTKTAGTVLPHIYTVMTTDPGRMKATSILPSGYVAPTSEQVQMAVQKQPIVIAAGQTQKSVPLTYTVQQPAVTSVQKVPSPAIQGDLASHMQKILPETYSEVPSALLQKVQSEPFGLVTEESSPQAYSVASTDEDNKNSNIPTLSLVVKDVVGANQPSAADQPSSEISAAQETIIHAVQNPEISTAESTDSGTAGIADPVQEIVQFSPELTDQVQEVVQYNTVTSNPDEITSSHDPTPASFPADSDENSGTTYTVTAKSLPTDEQQKDQQTAYASTGTENVENLMQLSDPTQTNIVVDSSDVQADVTSSS
jgi:KRAB domain-containing zinc finger protein